MVKASIFFILTSIYLLVEVKEIGAREIEVKETQAVPGQIDNRRQELLIEPLDREKIERQREAVDIAPASSASSPTAFGASWGSVFAASGFQARTRFTDEADGAIGMGFGLGDSEKLGVTVNVTVFDLKDEPASRGGIGFKVHRRVAEDFYAAVGVENAVVWGFTDAGTSGYGVATKVFRLRDDPQSPFSTLTVSLGVGGGRFRSEDDINDGVSSVNLFGSVGLRVAKPVTAIADWTGQDLTLGASIVPLNNTPFFITPSVADITGNAGDGARFILGVGYSF